MKVVSNPLTLLVVAGLTAKDTVAFTVGQGPTHASSTSLNMAAPVGLYFSTIGGATHTCAKYIGTAVGDLTPVEIDEAKIDEVLAHDAIIVGAPTWNTGADTERSMTVWDDWLYKTLPNLDLKGKKVAVFGVGDQVGYSDNYADAVAELYDCFTAQGCEPFGKTSTEGYRHVESKAEVDGKFVGLLFDEDNQYDLSEGRANAWVAQLKEEGFLA